MPSYVSHTIMAKDVYKKLDNKNVDLDYMVTFSLGGDLCKYAKCRYESHHTKQKEFLYNMCDYIKNNNLIDDKECLGVLYGHICHLVMDEEMHPFIKNVDKLCKKNKKNHTLLELYYDNYLTNLKYKVKLNKYNNKDLFKAKIDKKISNMINYSYEKTYNCNNISRYYKFNISLYKKIKYIYKLITFNFLKRISGMNRFLIVNKGIDLVKTSDRNNENIIDCYNKSVDKAIKEINMFTKYLNE